MLQRSALRSICRAGCLLATLCAFTADAAHAQDTFTLEARFVVDPDTVIVEPARAGLAGFVGWRTTPLLLDQLSSLGAANSRWRRLFTVHDPDSGRDVGKDFVLAKAQGMYTLLTCVGTPQALSPYPERTENQYGTGLPEYARFLPPDVEAWADGILVFIEDMERDHGVVPDGIELWNEPDRIEWCACSASEYLEFYRRAAQRIRSVRPGLEIGGPGLAGYRSALDGSETLLFALLRHAGTHGAPLDFVSWHHYGPATELRYSQIVQQLDSLGAQLGLAPFATAVTEWNIAPSAEGALGPDFDGPHAAANLIGFYATAAAHGLDRNHFFLDRDEENDRGVTDLAGESLGAITKHGLRKPVAQAIKLMLESAGSSAIPVEPPPDEYNTVAFASRESQMVRLILGNDVVAGSWVFTNSARQFGMEPSWLQPIWLAAGGPQATLATLMAEGLTLEQAEIVLAFMPGVLLADRLLNEARQVRIEVAGSAPFTITRVLRFTDTVNAPAQHRAALLPFLTAVFDRSTLLGCDAGAAELSAAGYPTTGAEFFAVLDTYFAWAAARGIPYALAESAWITFLDVRRDMQLMDAEMLNNLPEMQLDEETAQEAGISIANRELSFLLDPDAAIIIELEF